MIGKPQKGVLNKKLSKILIQRPGYSLDLVGHSLGAGVATILALMWAELSISFLNVIDKLVFRVVY